jgi:4-hydroxy-2-oxoheptanedioate aldolase
MTGRSGPPSLAARIREGRPLAGTVLSVADAALAELVCERLDFVWIDLEHGQLGPRDVQLLAIAARAAGCAALVRLPRADCERLPALLDAGVDGVVAPRVEDAATARRLVEQLRHPPLGTRGIAPRRGNAYGRAGTPRQLACVVQIESAAGVEHAAEIASVDGVDALVVGCSDLALELGTAGELGSDVVLDAVRVVQQAAADAGVASGVAAFGDAATLAQLIGGRSTMVVFSSDVRLYAGAVDDAVDALAQIVARGASEGAWPST